MLPCSLWLVHCKLIFRQSLSWKGTSDSDAASSGVMRSTDERSASSSAPQRASTMSVAACGLGPNLASLMLALPAQVSIRAMAADDVGTVFIEGALRAHSQGKGANEALGAVA